MLPQDPTNPAYSYYPNIRPLYHNFGQVWPILLSQFSPTPPPIPGSIPSEYGSNPLQSYWQYQQSRANLPSYSYALGLDQAQSGRNLSIMTQKVIRSAGVKLNENQYKAVQTAVGYMAQYLPMATQIAQQLLATEGVDNSSITQIISGVQSGLDYLNGPRGSVMPAYYQMQRQLGYMPVSDQRDFLYGYMHTLGAVNGDLEQTGGYRFADVGAIQNYAYSRGLNQVALADTGIARDVAQSILSDPRYGLGKKDNNTIYDTLDRLAEQKYNKRFSATRDAGSFEDSIGKQIDNAKSYKKKQKLQKQWDRIQEGFSISDRIRQATDNAFSMVHNTPLITDVATLEQTSKDLQAKIDKLDATKDKAKITEYKQLREDITSYIDTLNKDPNLETAYNTYQSN